MRELDKLRQAADYTSCDGSGLAGWLGDLMPELRRYTYQMLKAGVTLALLPQLSNSHLTRDCRINNGVHRLLISQAAKRTYAHPNCQLLMMILPSGGFQLEGLVSH